MSLHDHFLTDWYLRNPGVRYGRDTRERLLTRPLFSFDITSAYIEALQYAKAQGKMLSCEEIGKLASGLRNQDRRYVEPVSRLCVVLADQTVPVAVANGSLDFVNFLDDDHK